MILEPLNDRECLGQLVARARELAATRMAYDVGARLRTTRNVVSYLQSLPQKDDDGTELVQVIACDVPQRLRFLPSDPNCFERALAALVLMEVIDPQTERMPVSVDEPERHTGIVERQRGGDWQPVDLFPRARNVARRRRRARNSSGRSEVASTILKQLGTITLAMLGAYDLVAWPEGVQFGIKGSPKHITRIGITLAPDDTYTVEFFRGRGLNLRQAVELESVYVDQLHEVIEHETGLDTRLNLRREGGRRARNTGVQDVMGVVHPIGEVAFSAFGLGGLAHDLGKLEQHHGWLRQPQSQLAAPTSTPARRDPELALDERRAGDERQSMSEPGGSPNGYDTSPQDAPRASAGAAPSTRAARRAQGDDNQETPKRIFAL